MAAAVWVRVCGDSRISFPCMLLWVGTTHCPLLASGNGYSCVGELLL